MCLCVCYVVLCPKEHKGTRRVISDVMGCGLVLDVFVCSLLDSQDGLWDDYALGPAERETVSERNWTSYEAPHRIDPTWSNVNAFWVPL